MMSVPVTLNHTFPYLADWSLACNGKMVDFRMVTAHELNQLLRRFYAAAAPKHPDKRHQKMGLVGA